MKLNESRIEIASSVLQVWILSPNEREPVLHSLENFSPQSTLLKHSKIYAFRYPNILSATSPSQLQSDF
ncbi:MAG: hypothetical protein GDA48_25875 [Hormoscilla sp. GM102CHS1]|nr:hypothetical protein [Hormoscilla sp. GM102CHS1]